MDDMESVREFEANPSLDDTLRKVFWKERVGLLDRIKIRSALRTPEMREEIEYSLSQRLYEAIVVGDVAIPAAGEELFSSAGIYVGSWQDLLQWILDNWPAILEMIMQIIALFV
jgi:hypothetical protein